MKLDLNRSKKALEHTNQALRLEGTIVTDDHQATLNKGLEKKPENNGNKESNPRNKSQSRDGSSSSRRKRSRSKERKKKDKKEKKDKKKDKKEKDKKKPKEIDYSKLYNI